MKEIYRGVKAPKYVTENRTSVELLKYVENTLDAMLISYWNEILEYAVFLGLETEEVVSLLEKIGEREKFQTVSRVPGKAFGLWCLPKDLRALIINMKEKGVSPNIMEGILHTNVKLEHQMGIGLVPAQALWEMSDGHVRILKDGKQQIDEYVKKRHNSIEKNGC